MPALVGARMSKKCSLYNGVVSRPRKFCHPTGNRAAWLVEAASCTPLRSKTALVAIDHTELAG
jgi:hypothetical protein